MEEERDGGGGEEEEEEDPADETYGKASRAVAVQRGHWFVC